MAIENHVSRVISNISPVTVIIISTTKEEQKPAAVDELDYGGPIKQSDFSPQHMRFQAGWYQLTFRRKEAGRQMMRKNLRATG